MKKILIIISSLLVMIGCVLHVSARSQENHIDVKIISLPEGSRLVAGMEIEVSVITAGEEEVSEVELFINDVSQGTIEEPPYIFEISDLPPNSVYRLRAVAKSTSGLIGIDSRIISEERTSDYSLRVDLITVYVSVNDAEGNYIRGLSQSDFLINENGDSQDISFFTSETTPLTAAFLMDVSSSMIGDRIIRAQNAAVDLVGGLIRNEDLAMVLGFDHRLLLYQGFTNDVAKLEQAIRLTGPNGGTALYDAVAGTTRKLFNRNGKRAIVVLSDGDDTDSDFSAEEVLDYLQKSSVIVYSVGLQTLTSAQTKENETRKTIRNLKEMADFSGGRAYFPSFISHLPRIYSAIGQDLRSQYTIAYYPKNKVKDGKWRTINVSVKNKPQLVVRHRKGYFAN